MKAAQEGGLFAGLNFWGWGGLAEQSQTNIYWQPGDDYCGDPAQEQQGLNSVYVSDESTMAILREAAKEVEAALGPKAWFHIDGNQGSSLTDSTRYVRLGKFLVDADNQR